MPDTVTISPSREDLQSLQEKSMRETLRNHLRKTFFIVVIVGIVNLALFLAGSYYLGGEAMKGKIETGRYYVWGSRHGKKGYTEVSHTAFVYSEWHGYSVIVTWPFLLLAGFRLGQNKRRS